MEETWASALTQVSAGDVAQTGDTSDASVRAPHMAAIFFAWRPTASSCNEVIIVCERVWLLRANG